MKPLSVFLMILAVRGVPGKAQKHCPVETVYLALSSEVRGYPANAHGSVNPCQIITGSKTGLATASSMAFGRDGSLHVAQFLTNGSVNVFPADANGNAAPLQTLFTFTNDLVSIGVDSEQNDFVVSVRQGGRIIRLTPGPANTQSMQVFLPPLIASSVAVDRDDHVLIGGWETNGAAVVSTFDLSGTAPSPTALQTLSLGLSIPLINIFLDAPDLNIALDPATQDLYVYTNPVDPSGEAPAIRVFAAGASGKATPIRTISGPNTGLGGPGSLGTNKIAVAAGGRLYVAEPGNRILVFQPGAKGDAAPDQIIQDSVPITIGRPQGGIAVRSFQHSSRNGSK